MENEAFAVYLKPNIYIDLVMQLRNAGDNRNPEDIIPAAVRHWLGANRSITQRGYQWKELFLPHGTELRAHVRWMYHYATVEGDRIMADGESVTPRSWLLKLSGAVHNPWRDIWIKRFAGDCWSRADVWRESHVVTSPVPFCDRRCRTRRTSDL